jgi:hypothetical protein
MKISDLIYGFSTVLISCTLNLGAAENSLEASAESSAAIEDRIGKVISSGKVNLDTRLRYEHADSTNAGIKPANALTFRNRLGYTTDSWNGLKGMVEFENVTALGGDVQYRNAPGPAANLFNREVVADPKGTEVNQVWIGYEKYDTNVKFGRQTFTLDNHRFIGNVIWRQNEQTYDAVSLVNNSMDDLTTTYAYLFGVNRIFGDNFGNAAGPADGDWESNSHVFHLSYDNVPYGNLTGYAYLLDLNEVAALSTSTFGLFYHGKAPLTDDFNLTYRAEFAHQTDYAGNAADHSAEYLNLQIGGEYKRVSGGIGYELLGSDKGATAFTTPLSTLHAFQGWGDLFLATPGGGIEDYQAWVGVKLPYEIPFKVLYHDYKPHEGGGGDYGHEINAIATRQFGKYFSGLVKYAYFDGDSMPVNVHKFWAQVEFSF